MGMCSIVGMVSVSNLCRCGMTDDEFLLLWRITYGDRWVDSMEAMEFKKVLPKDKRTGYLFELHMKDLIIRRQDGWRLP